MSQQRKAQRCTGCGRVQPLEEFDRDPARRDGRASHCKACRRVRQRAQGHPWARRAQRWLARQHPDRWAEAYRARKRQARAELPDVPRRRAQARAWSRALADMQAAYPEEYAARYQVELAAYRREHGYVQPFASLSEKVDRRVLTRARAAALEALAVEYPEQAERLASPVLTGLPGRHAGGDAGGGQAAGVGPAAGAAPAAVPGLLRRRTGPPRRPGQAGATAVTRHGRGLGRRLPAAGSAARPGHRGGGRWPPG